MNLSVTAGHRGATRVTIPRALFLGDDPPQHALFIVLGLHPQGVRTGTARTSMARHVTGSAVEQVSSRTDREPLSSGPIEISGARRVCNSSSGVLDPGLNPGPVGGPGFFVRT